MSIFKTQLFLYGNFDFLLIRKIEKERNTQTPKLKNENKKRYKRHRIIHDRSVRGGDRKWSTVSKAYGL